VEYENGATGVFITSTGDSYGTNRFEVQMDKAKLVAEDINGTTKLTVLEATQEFYKVDCYDMVGYIAKSQVSVNENGEYYVNCAKGSQETKYLPFYGMQAALELRNDLLKAAKNYIGVPYVYGGTSRWGFDCSGYVQYVCKQFGVSLNRTANAQMSNGYSISADQLIPGDLVFFHGTYSTGGASHVGIYIGNGQFVHASSGRGCVTISDLWSNYYTNHYYGARRVF
jgi:hypothetical protein